MFAFCPRLLHARWLDFPQHLTHIYWHIAFIVTDKTELNDTKNTNSELETLQSHRKQQFSDEDSKSFSPIMFDASSFLIQSVKEGRWRCPECGRIYKLKSSLRNHIKWECGKAPQFKCPYCSYEAKQKMHLARHLDRVHKEIDYSCLPEIDLTVLEAAKVMK